MCNLNDREKELAYKYAWNWFSYHAKQRYTAFYYFLLTIGALSWAYSQSYKPINQTNATNIIAVAIGIIGLILSFSFLFIERRGVELVDDGRDLLDQLERETFPFTNFSIRKTDIERKTRCCNCLLIHECWIRIVLVSSVFFSTMAIVYALGIFKDYWWISIIALIAAFISAIWPKWGK